MTRRPCPPDCSRIEDLGFGQLNDLLLVMLFPEMAQEFFESDCEDERELSKLLELSRTQPFLDFGVVPFVLEVERRIRKLWSDSESCRETNGTADALIANLCWVAFAVERWGQSVLRYQPGHAAKSVRLGNSSETLHRFLTRRLGNYNTLEHFALRSIGTVNGIRRFRYRAGEVIDDGVCEIESAYRVLAPHADPTLSRFPSTLDMTPFLEVIKRGELAAQVYNDLALELIWAIRDQGLDSEKALDLASGVSLGLRIAKQAIIDFLGDDRFSTGKFIYILRQFTVELDNSPASLVLQSFNLEAHEAILAKGFLNHYLQAVPNEDQSRGLVAWQWLRNEGVEMPNTGAWLAQFESARPTERVDLCRIMLGRTTSQSDMCLVQDALVELVGESEVGRGRIRYTLDLFKKLIPRVANTTDKLATDDRLIHDLENKLFSSTYALAPSGANSLAFFGGDVLLGLVDQVSNYRTHLLTRLPIMVSSDRLRYWKFVRSDFPGLPVLLQQVICEQVRSRLGDGASSLAIVSELNGEEILKLSKYQPYFELIDALADLSKAHNASVEKFLRRVALQMARRTKEHLLSSPDHGTTFMQPSRVSMEEDSRLMLPSLDKLNSVRTMNQRFAREFLERGACTRPYSSGFYRSFFCMGMKA